MKIAFGCDHGGFAAKEKVFEYFDKMGYEVTDYGCFDENSVDYPDVAYPVCKDVKATSSDFGVLICGTGIGMSIVANKFKGIRCAPCYDEETAKQAKEHSNVNVLALPAAYLSTSKAIQIMRVWVASEFLGGRYSERLQMIADVEKENMK